MTDLRKCRQTGTTHAVAVGMGRVDRRKYDFDVMEHVFSGVRSSTADQEAPDHLLTVDVNPGVIASTASTVEVSALDRSESQTPTSPSAGQRNEDHQEW